MAKKGWLFRLFRIRTSLCRAAHQQLAARLHAPGFMTEPASGCGERQHGRLMSRSDAFGLRLRISNAEALLLLQSLERRSAAREASDVMDAAQWCSSSGTGSMVEVQAPMKQLSLACRLSHRTAKQAPIGNDSVLGTCSDKLNPAWKVSFYVRRRTVL